MQKKVTAAGILPITHSGLTRRLAELAQAGAGIATLPMEAVPQALRAFYRHFRGREAAA